MRALILTTRYGRAKTAGAKAAVGTLFALELFGMMAAVCRTGFAAILISLAVIYVPMASSQYPPGNPETFRSDPTGGKPCGHLSDKCLSYFRKDRLVAVSADNGSFSPGDSMYPNLYKKMGWSREKEV